MKRPDPVEAVKDRRDAALAAIVAQIPYAAFQGVSFDRHGDQLTATLSYSPELIGNPVLPALHGGATAAFLETTAIVGLTWLRAWDAIEAGGFADTTPIALPKTIDFTIDYLRSGLPRDAYAQVTVNRSGRRYASVHVEGWQDHRSKLFAQATGHFLMPSAE
ncbi:MAG: PaaI family thioesterase [Planktomarina sp.]